MTSVRTIFTTFLRLGLTSFGGPIAHIGYFRRALVEQRRWLTEEQFTQLLALSQFLPGPASSQLGFGIGLLRGGWLGAIAAFVAFTLPSALLLFLLAKYGAWVASPIGLGVTHGLKLVAVAVVAHGTVRMARQMAPDLPRAGIATLVCLAMLLIEGPGMQILVILVGSIAGIALVRSPMTDVGTPFALRFGSRTAITAALLFAAGLVLALAWPTRAPVLGSIASAFWSAGALVFGGGHVVLPLLEQSVVATGWVSTDTFLAGYGAAQSIPGPMFSIAAYLGAHVPTGLHPALGAIVATISIFAPGFLLLVAALPAWARLTEHPRAVHAVMGANAAVVGLLAAAFADPVFRSGVRGPVDLGIASVGLALLWSGERSALWAVVWCIGAGILSHALGLA